MKYKKIMLLLITAIFLISIAGVCASDANDTMVASEDANQIEVSSDNIISEDSLKTSEENAILAQANDGESDSQILSEGNGTYSDLRTDIANGGNLTKSNYKYQNNDGDTIEITTPMVINGNGAVIDMAGSNIRAFYVTASGVTIRNLTIKNADFEGDGGAIFFDSCSGTVENCNFNHNEVTGNYMLGGAISMDSGTVTNCNFDSNIVSGEDSGAGAIYIGSGTVANCNFTYNYVYGEKGQGGAIWMHHGDITNCNFYRNIVYGKNGCGGAIYLDSGNITNCNLTDNTLDDDVDDHALSRGGAVYLYEVGNVINCSFVDNRCGLGDESYGGAVYFENKNYYAVSDGGKVINCIFDRNIASVSGAIFSGEGDITADTCIFKTDYDRVYVGVNVVSPSLNVDNFITSYNSGEKLTFNLTTNSGMRVYNGNIFITVYYKNNGSRFCDYGCLSGEGWTVDLPAGSYYASYDTKYEEFQAIERTITVNKANSSLNVSDVTLDYGTSTDVGVTAEGVIAITAKIDDVNATVDGYAIMIPVLDAGSHTLTVTTIADANHNNVTKNATITVSRAKTQLMADAVITTYNSNNNLVISLKDGAGRPLSGLNITVDLNGVKNYTTDTSGQVKISTRGLAANTYEVLIAFNGTENYVNCSKTTTVSIYKESSAVDTKPLTTVYNVYKYLVVGLKDKDGNAIRNADAYIVINGMTYKCRSDDKGNARLIIRLNPGKYAAKITFDDVNYIGFTQHVTVIVKKATPKLTAKKKTFKAKKKVKKYTVTLKDNNGKAMKKVKLTIKVGKKTFKAKTNAKGKAVFKIKKLTKKGKYKATVKFAGNKFYSKVTKKVKITVK